MKKNVNLFYRDPLECIQSILSNPLMSDHIRFTPFRVYESAVSAMRIYTKWLSGDTAWSMQSQLPDGATLLGVVLSSDKMNISAMTGGHVAHPLLISLANLLMDFCMKGTNHAFLLLALLPIPNFIHKDSKTHGILENRMVHECLDFILTQLKKAAQFGIMMSDPLGSLRYMFTPLAAYIADVAEEVALACVARKTSHMTMASYKQFGDPFRHEPRTASTTLAQLHAIEARVNPWHLNTYIKETMKNRQNSSHQNPFTIGTKCSGTTMRNGASTLTKFREGISKLKQVTGREHRDIQHYIVAIIADAVPNDFLVHQEKRDPEIFKKM
ncbi:hypothetical protein EDB85DRAFT_2147995 [Lactarius pseudohatsudake]|nr:hypothetical protein EDB85DRAFT_2147995 [Lactarius pseudohatsudake]